MSKNEPLQTLAPDLPRKPGPPGTDSRGRFNGPLSPAKVRKRARTQVRRNARTGLRAKANQKIDKRRTVDRRVLDTVAALEDALGERLTPQRSLILANIARKLLDLALIEAYEADRGTIVDTRRRAPLQITIAKWKLLDSINRDLERIGLDRTARKATSLADIMAGYGQQQSPAEGSSHASDVEIVEDEPADAPADASGEPDPASEPTGRTDAR